MFTVTVLLLPLLVVVAVFSNLNITKRLQLAAVDIYEFTLSSLRVFLTLLLIYNSANLMYSFFHPDQTRITCSKLLGCLSLWFNSTQIYFSQILIQRTINTNIELKQMIKRCGNRITTNTYITNMLYYTTSTIMSDDDSEATITWVSHIN